MSPDGMDSTAIPLQEIPRIEDRAASASLNAAPRSDPVVSEVDNIPDAPSDAELDIFAAAQQGNIERIRALNESGRARETDRDEENVTPLHWAAIKGQDAACTYLVEQGAEVNAVGGKELATPLHWVARNGLVTTIDLLIQHGADPRLVDARGHSCLHSVAHSGKYLALLYVVCRPEIAIDEPDSLGYTPLHYAVYWRDEVSTHILLKLGANPNVVDHDGLTPLHWAACKGSKKCIKGLLEAGADIRAKDKNRRTAEEIASEFRNRDAWNVVVEELGIKADGSRVRRPLSEPSVNIIVFSVPAISLCIAFLIAGVFPWYMSITLSPAAFYALSQVVIHEVLQRNSIKDSLEGSPYFLGITFGSAFWVAYAWITRLRHDAPSWPSLHAGFLSSFVLFVFALLCIVFCDPGISITQTKDDLKSITEVLVRSNRLTEGAFCVRCLAEKSPGTTHCPICNKCVTRHKFSPIHASCMRNCIGKKNYIYFIVVTASLLAGVLIFDYLVWRHLHTLTNLPIPARSCLLSHSFCKVISADMFLISITVWSTLNLVWTVGTIIYYAIETWEL